jgi:hypothetical protein
MKLSWLKCSRIVLMSAFVFSAALAAGGQAISVVRRVTQAVDEQNRVILRGNTHPLARPEFDRGAAPDNQPMRRMLLLLQRSPEQEGALRKLLDEQQIKSSANYHQWLTPEQFGEQFGPADADLQAVSDWLSSHGFEVNRVAAGRMVIEFSGTAAQVRQAFHTEIHKFAVEGKEHWANSNDPQIPAALAPVVSGVVSLNNFPRKPLYRTVGVFGRSKLTSKVEPLYTVTSNGTTYYALGPTDFATIYNVMPLWSASPAIDGSGVTIAIVGQTNINMSDVTSFRSMWNLPASNTQVVLNGPDPGIRFDEGEADADTQWSGAVAKNATIDLVVSETTETTAGIDLSALYIVDNNMAPVMSESYGACEAFLGSAGNAFYNSLWQQGAAQGITIIIASGDSGSDVCDFHFTAATHGLTVSGTASTPFNVAVGGTDFNDASAFSTYWNSTNNSSTESSAKSYIPESTWNNSCASSGLTACSSPNGLVAGSGGPSSVYAKPPWQTGAGVPNDGVRDSPDVSLYAAGGSASHSFYAVCESDVLPGGEACSLNAFLGAGGTSLSAPAFAGIMAMVVQKTGQRQGNANYVLYPLSAQSGASCTSNPAAVASTGCVFYDVVTGNNSVPCQGGTPNCSVSSGYGVLVDPNNPASEAWTTTAGYDLATGLGSVNAANLVNQWSSVSFTPTTTTLSLSTTPPTSPITITHGQPMNVNINVSAHSGTPTGAVSLIGGPNNSKLGIDFAALTGGSASGTSVFLPGGTYGVTAHYAGDGTFGASDSTPPVQVTVTPESSVTTVRLITFDFNTGLETNPNATNITYGTPDLLRMDVTNASGNLCAPQGGLPQYPCPTGTVTVTGQGNVPIDLGSYGSNSQGYTEDQLIQLSPNSYSIVANYGGDSSYSASASATVAITVTPAPTATTLNAPSSVGAGDNFSLQATVNTQSTGAGPGAFVQFSNGSSAIAIAGCTGFAFSRSTGIPAYCTATATASLASTATITAQYGGDPNYAASSSAPFTITVTPEFNLAANPTSFNIASPGLSGTTSLSVTAAGGFTGTVNFTCLVPFGMNGGGCSLNPASVTNSGTTTLTVTTTAASSALPNGGPFNSPGWFVFGLTVAVFIMLVLIVPVKKGRPKLAFGLLLLALLVAALAECGGGGGGGGGGGNPGTAPGLYTIGVTGTSGGITHSVSIAVNVL